jgi:hypothetical protein
VASAGEDTLKLSRNGLRIPTLKALVLLNTPTSASVARENPAIPSVAGAVSSPLLKI